MFILDPDKWKRITSRDVKPSFPAFIRRQVYYRASTEPAISGQMERGSPVFWQIAGKASENTDLEINDVVFWQELGDVKKAYYWKYQDNDLIIVNKRDDGSIERSDRSTVYFGKFDAFNCWYPRYQKVPLLHILHNHSFDSLKTGEKHCLAIMLLKANDGGRIYNLTYNELALMTSYSNDTVAKHLKALTEKRLIRERKKSGEEPENARKIRPLRAMDYQVHFGYTLLELDGISLNEYQGRRPRRNSRVLQSDTF